MPKAQDLTLGRLPSRQAELQQEVIANLAHLREFGRMRRNNFAEPADRSRVSTGRFTLHEFLQKRN
jgi:hypothetical protein